MSSNPLPFSLCQKIRSATRGEFRADELTRALYSTDASIYRISPRAVFYPRDAQDIAALIDVLKETDLQVIGARRRVGLGRRIARAGGHHRFLPAHEPYSEPGPGRRTRSRSAGPNSRRTQPLPCPAWEEVCPGPGELPPMRHRRNGGDQRRRSALARFRHNARSHRRARSANRRRDPHRCAAPPPQWRRSESAARCSRRRADFARSDLHP